MNKTMWPATLTVLPNRLNCICKQIETHWNYSWNIWLWKGLDKRTSRHKLKQTFSPDQTRKTLFKTKKLRHSRSKEEKKEKNLGHIQNRWQELQSEFVFWMGKQLPRQPLCLKLKKQNRRTKKTSETWWQLAWNEDCNWHCAQCSWKGASANRFS